VPNSDGTKTGIFTEGARDLMDVGRVTSQMQPPWQQFPMQWQELANLIGAMLSKQLQQRPRAAQLLQHPWFKSQSNSNLPPDSVARIVSGSAAAYFEGELVNTLCDSCNLDELRVLQRQLDALGRGAPLPADRFIAEVCAVVEEGGNIVRDYVSAVSAGGRVQYQNLLNAALKEKESRCSQLVVNLFHEMDKDHDGYLDEEEIRAMLASDAYELELDDVDSALEEMDMNQDGLITLEELRNYVLADGRISTKVKCDAGVKASVGLWKRLFG